MAETVTFGGRTFEVGATYLPKRARPNTGRRTFRGLSTRQGSGWVDCSPRPDVPHRVAITKGGWPRWAGDRLGPADA